LARVGNITALLIARELPLDAVLLFKAAIMGIVEGSDRIFSRCRVRPLDSCRLADRFTEETVKSAKLFEIVIQAGALVAVVWSSGNGCARLWLEP